MLFSGCDCCTRCSRCTFLITFSSPVPTARRSGSGLILSNCPRRPQDAGRKKNKKTMSIMSKEANCASGVFCLKVVFLQISLHACESHRRQPPRPSHQEHFIQCDAFWQHLCILLSCQFSVVNDLPLGRVNWRRRSQE